MMIHDIFHRNNETKQVTMAYVESNNTLYTTLQKPTKLTEKFLATFKAQIGNLMQARLAKICE